jgi:3-oxoacyl-[acyl-carrier protein] reductase
LLALRESARRVVDGGRVVLLSSAAAQLAPARQSTYAAAKAGLEAAARVAAKEVAARGITVNVVRPGATDTEALRRGTSPKAIEAMSGANAMRRLGTPDDIAGAVLMLCAADSGWVTGAVIDATGGLT